MSLRELILSNIWLKLFSLVLAMLIWFTIWTNLENDARLPWRSVRHEKVREFIARPVLVLSGSGEHKAFKVDPQVVDVILQGSIAALDKLKPGDLEVFVRPPGLGEPTGRLDVQVYRPAGVTLVKISPPSVSVHPVEQP